MARGRRGHLVREATVRPSHGAPVARSLTTTEGHWSHRTALSARRSLERPWRGRRSHLPSARLCLPSASSPPPGASGALCPRLPFPLFLRLLLLSPSVSLIPSCLHGASEPRDTGAVTSAVVAGTCFLPMGGPFWVRVLQGRGRRRKARPSGAAGSRDASWRGRGRMEPDVRMEMRGGRGLRAGRTGADQSSKAGHCRERREVPLGFVTASSPGRPLPPNQEPSTRRTVSLHPRPACDE